MIPESSIAPVDDLPNSEEFSKDKPDTSLLAKTVVLKLNGGLGTGMGLDKAKSLLQVKGNDTFLDLTAKQVIQMRKEYGFNVKFMLMNSFSTSADTLAFFHKNYPSLAKEEGLEMMQNKVPKLHAETFEVRNVLQKHTHGGDKFLSESYSTHVFACILAVSQNNNIIFLPLFPFLCTVLYQTKPATCPSNRDNEWCPPGHGDLYAALVGSGRLDQLLKDGFQYMFVSNSDNLGASLDLNILTYFAQNETPFMMECCQRTENDKKGGHLALRKKDNQLVLRESAMCLEADEDAFQDVTKHRFFNTNNLWIRLDKLKEIIDANGGFIPLPMIKNKKTVDPKDDTSQKVVQLETAMGAAVECFDGATAICVPRTRFTPVKKCNDLFLLRSDAYVLQNFKPVLNPKCGGKAPVISLDSKKYKLVDALDEATEDGIPSLVRCKRLTVTGLVKMSKKTTFVDEVSITNKSDEAKYVPHGEITGDHDLTNSTFQPPNPCLNMCSIL